MSNSQILLNNPYKFEPIWEPGTFSSYHTIGPLITSYIIEDESKMSYEDFIQEKFFEPLNMPRSTFLINSDVKKSLVNYQDSTFDHTSARPASALMTSTYEFMNILKLLINNGSFEGQQVISKESIDRFESSTTTIASQLLGITDGHGINSWSMYFDGIRYQTHAGKFGSYLAQYAYSRKNKTGYIFMVEGAKQNVLKKLNTSILPYLEALKESNKIDQVASNLEDEFIGCYQKVQKSRVTDPIFKIEIRRDSSDQLAILDENFKNPPFLKSLKPSDHKYIYIDDKPINNLSLHGETRYAFLTLANKDKIIQKISYPWDAYIKIACND